MNEWNDQQLDSLVRGHLSAELDGQSGKAEAAFLRRLASPSDVTSVALADAPADLERPRSNGHVNRFRGWVFTFAGAALAASIAALAAAPSLFPNHPAAVPRPGQSAGRPDRIAEGPEPELLGTEDQPLLKYVQSRTWDEGTVVLDGSVPARKLRHQWLERMEFYDPREGVRREVTIPREHIRYVEMDTY